MLCPARAESKEAVHVHLGGPEAAARAAQRLLLQLLRVVDVNLGHVLGASEAEAVVQAQQELMMSKPEAFHPN